MPSLARLAPLTLLGTSWLALRSLDAASALGVAQERLLGRGIVALFALALVAEAWRAMRGPLRARLAAREGRRALVLAALGYALVHALVSGALRLRVPTGGGTAWRAGDGFGPLTVWPSLALDAPWAGIAAQATAGRLLLMGALALVFACCLLLAAPRLGRRAPGVAGACAPALAAAACPACAGPLLPALLALAGAMGAPVASALADPTSLGATLLEVGAPLLAALALARLSEPACAGAPLRLARADRRHARLAALALPLALWPAVHAEVTFAGFPRGASEGQDAIYSFFLVVSVAALLVLAVVVAALAYYSIRYRLRDAAPAGRPTHPQGARRLLVAAFVAVPAIVILGLGVLSHALLLDLEEPPEDALTLEVVGQQFKWSFVHPDGAVVENELRVPVGEPVVLRVTSVDAIHSLFIPDLGVKTDAIPGHYNEVSFRALRPGTYDAYCVEFCGVLHAEMRARIVVLPEGAPLPYAR